MSGALNAVTSGELKVSEAVVKYRVPHQTLRDRLSGYVIHGTNPGLKPYLIRGGRVVNGPSYPFSQTWLWKNLRTNHGFGREIHQ